MAEARECTLGPWELKLVSIGDEIAHAIAETSYPYKNGSDIEDMGVDAEKFRFSCVITNKDYDDNYKKLRLWFLSIFNKPVKLWHPDHGELEGFPKNVSFSNDRRKKCATFEFDFVIAGIQKDVQSFQDPFYACAVEAEEVNKEVQAQIADDMQKAGVPDVEGEDWSLMDYWGKIGDTARAFAEGVSSALGKVNGVIAQVKAVPDAISSTIDYAGTLSGKLTESLQSCCDSFVAMARKAKNITSSSSASYLYADLSEMLLSLAGSPTYAAFATLAASTLATETAKHISDDESRMGESIASEKTQVDDAEGRLVADVQEPFVTTPGDLEGAIAVTRQFINAILPFAISPERLKKQAALLSDAVLRIKMEYMTTKKINVEHETPMHKIALENGLDYKACDRLCALNNIKNPTFVQGEVLVYER